jgi:CMP-N,N'-diacetyllegionaminic acid synthase
MRSLNNVNALAIIPARGGSRRIAGKNLLPLAGRPLLAHTIHHAREAEHVSEVLVSTDDDDIAAVATREGAGVIRRPSELAGDAVPSEAALLQALDQRRTSDPELLVFLQATSPARRPRDIDGAIELLVRDGADSLFSACREATHIWRRENGELCSISYDWRNRPRTQDMSPQWRENGSIYVLRPWVLRENRNRLGGRIAVYEMDSWTSVDLEDDAELLDWILRSGRLNPR